jgi:hypothetical protein
MIRQAAIHGIHSIFPPTPITNHADSKKTYLGEKAGGGGWKFHHRKI